MAYKMTGPLFFGKKRRAKKDAEVRASALEQANTNEDLKNDIEEKTGKTVEQLREENE